MIIKKAAIFILLLFPSILICIYLSNVLKQNHVNERIFNQSLNWVNPKQQVENWNKGLKTKSAGGLWSLIMVDGGGLAKPFQWHSSAVKLSKDIQDNQAIASLELYHDPNFESESKTNVTDITGSERYNNAFLIGMNGWLPKPKTSKTNGSVIVAEFRAKWELGNDSYGSSGVWFESNGTFDPSGRMVKPFQAVGISWLGQNSILMSGLNMESVVNNTPTFFSNIRSLDLKQWNKFVISVKWKNENKWTYSLKINDLPSREVTINPIGPMELQIWKDNYLVKFNILAPFKLDYENIPINVIDRFQIKEIQVYEREL